MVRTTPSISASGSNETPGGSEFYPDPLPSSRITKVARWGDGGPAPKGSVMTVAFRLAGYALTAINGGPRKLTPAVSLVVSCETQDEIDHYRDTLLADGGKPSMCSWLEDRFGLSWQVVPSVIGELLTDADPSKAARAGRALMSMQKLDLAALQRAHRGDLATA